MNQNFKIYTYLNKTLYELDECVIIVSRVLQESKNEIICANKPICLCVFIVIAILQYIKIFEKFDETVFLPTGREKPKLKQQREIYHILPHLLVIITSEIFYLL